MRRHDTRHGARKTAEAVVTNSKEDFPHEGYGCSIQSFNEKVLDIPGKLINEKMYAFISPS